MSTINVKGEGPSVICNKIKPSDQISNRRVAQKQGKCDLIVCVSGAEPKEINHRKVEEFSVKKSRIGGIRDFQICSIRINPPGQENQ